MFNRHQHTSFLLLELARNLMMQRYGIRCTIAHQNSPAFRWENDYIHWTGSTKGKIAEIYTMDLTNTRSNSTCPLQVQIVVMDILPEPRESWAECIVDGFDIDICMGYIIPDPNLFSSAQREPICFPDEVQDTIDRGEFNYMVRPHPRFNLTLKRIYKYIHRGFQLKGIYPSNRCTTEFFDHVTYRMEHLHAPSLCTKALVNSGKIDRETARCIAEQHMIRYFDLPNKTRADLHMRHHAILNVLDALSHQKGEIHTIQKWTHHKYLHYIRLCNVWYIERTINRLLLPVWKHYLRRKTSATIIQEWYRDCLVRQRPKKKPRI